MQFDDPRTILESAAAKPERGIDAHALVKRGRSLRRARYAAAVAGLAVTLAAASASVGMLRTSDRAPRPAAGDESCGMGTSDVDYDCLVETYCDGPLPSQVSIFLMDGADEREVDRLRRELSSMTGVEGLDYVSRQEAYEEFRSLYEDRPDLYETIGPSDLPASVRLTAASQTVIDRIHALDSPAVDEIRSGGDFIGRLCELETAQDPAPSTEPDDGWRDLERYEPVEAAPGVEADLLSAECGAGPLHLSATQVLDEPERAWCRFDLRVTNHGRAPAELRYEDQALTVSGSMVDPWMPGGEAPDTAGDLFVGAIDPGVTETGQTVFLVEHGKSPRELELWGSFLPTSIAFVLDYDCPRDLPRDRGTCSFDGVLKGLPQPDPSGPMTVSLYHCGVDPVMYGGRQWVVTEPPFDATNAPAGFTGEGWFELVSADRAIFEDRSGTHLRFRAIDWWQPPPCD